MNEEYIKKSDLLNFFEDNKPMNWTDSEAEIQADSDYEKYFEMIKNFPATKVIPVRNCNDCKYSATHPDELPCVNCASNYNDCFMAKEIIDEE